MNKEEKLKDNSKLLKIVIIILFIAFFVLGISQCVNDAIKTTYADNEITEIVEVNNKFIDKSLNKVNSADFNSLVGTLVVSNESTLVNQIYVNTLLDIQSIMSYLNENITFYDGSSIGVPLPFYPVFANYNSNDNNYLYVLGFIKYANNNIHFGYVNFLTMQSNPLLFPYDENWNFLANPVVINSYGISNVYGFEIGSQNDKLLNIVSMNVPFTSGGSSGGITPNERYENPLFTIPSGYEKITEITYDINPSQTTYNVAKVVVCGKPNFDIENNEFYYDFFYGFACGGVKKEYELVKFTRLTNGVEDLFLNDRFLIQINIAEQNSISFYLSYYQENTNKFILNEEMQCNSSYPSNNFFNSKGLNSMLLTRNFIKNYYNDIGFENGRVYGYEQGLNDGNVEGYNQGYQEGYDTGYLEGDTAGYNRGFIDGEDDGYDLGYREGKVDGYNEGYAEGEDVGLSNGYSNGFNDGQKDEIGKNGFQKVFNSILNAPYNILNGILNFEIFGINLFNFFSFIFTTFLIIFVIGLIIKR